MLERNLEPRLESPGKDLLRLLVERDPASPEFRSGVRAALHPAPHAAFRPTELPGGEEVEFDLWRDVFVQQKLPWGRFLQSALLHTAAVALIWTISLSWIRQQKILDHATFDRSSLVTYSPEEYLPPLDTGASEAPKTQKGDPVYAKQPILSVPREADNRSQTIVVPPDLKLDRDVPLPNIVATGAIVALVVTGTALSLPAMIGLLMLTGIVVTNAIVLLDLVEQYRERGLPLQQALIEGGRHRLRPILMTAVATMLALAPLAFSGNSGGGFIGAPLAIVVIGGLFSSTLLTLILVPVLYSEASRFTSARTNRELDTMLDAAQARRLAAGGGR